MRSPLLIATLALVGCGPGSPGGPSMNNRLNAEPMPVGPAIQSNDILARQGTSSRVMVRHILIGWSGRGESQSTRTRGEADTLARNLLGQVRSGAPIVSLMAAHSEDHATAKTGAPIEVTPTASLVDEFRRLSLRLEPGEVGLVLSDFGWHVIQRAQ